jgi:ATP-dependent protease HslVU (ClpYQ) peptidase subunit
MESTYGKREMTRTQLFVGIVLVLASLPIYAMGVGDIAYLSMLAAIVLACGAGGMYALLAAPRALIEEKQLGGR